MAEQASYIVFLLSANILVVFGSQYAKVNSSCMNTAELVNTTILDYNANGTARLIAFGNATLDAQQSYYLAFLNFTPNVFTLSLLICGYMGAGEQIYGSAMKVIWTANRDRPVSDQATLQFAPDGNLMLWDSDGINVWSTLTSTFGVESMSLEAGCLQLLNGTNYSVWQSCDYPTDTLMVGHKLVFGQEIVPWASPSNSSSGPYSLTMYAGGLALSASVSNLQSYWMWGFFGNDTFSVSHTCNYLMNAEFVKNQTLELLLYQSGDAATSATNYSAFCSRLGSSSGNNSSSFIIWQHGENVSQAFLRVERDGNLRAYAFTNSTGWNIVWELFNSSTAACLLPSHCGYYGICVDPGQCNGCPIGDDGAALRSFDGSSCLPVVQPTCTNSTKHAWEMITMTSVDYFATQYLASQNLSSKEECMQLCLENCSCAASFYHIEFGYCSFIEHVEGSLHRVSNASKVAFLKFSASDLLSPSGSSSSHQSIIIGVVTGVLGAFLLGGLIYTYVVVRRAAKSAAKTDEPKQDVEDSGIFQFAGTMPTRFSFKDLETATSGFTEKLGNGAFGVVYKGVLPDGRVIAVKKLEGAMQGHKEFCAEVAALGSIHHWHLVQLYGFCVEQSHRLLVYEYLPNGSLDNWLFSRKTETVLSWNVRFQIALGMAKGLAYLHEDCKEKIIHLDIKPQNVLLDQNFVAKVADFGLSRFTSREEEFVVTTMRGTPGYLAPEWLLDAAITEKSDVYSYGMVLLELASGRRNQMPRKSRSSLPSGDRMEDCYYFPAWALRMAGEKREAELIDGRLRGRYNEGEARRVMRVALLCVQEDAKERPSMGRVVQMLLGEGGEEVPEPPMKQNVHMFLEAHFKMMAASSSSSSSSSSSCEPPKGEKEEEDDGSSIVYSSVSGR